MFYGLQVMVARDERTSICYLHPYAKLATVQTDRPKLLVIDDEALVLMAVEDALVEAGYEVVAVASAAEAMEALEAGVASIRCVVTDIRLPGKLTGWDIAKRARQLDASMPIIYMTGDSVGQWAVNGVPESMVLGKPYAMSQLVTAVAQLTTARTNNLANYA